MRIISLLPSATEMVYALGLGDQLVGVSHTCDYPDDANGKPVVSRSIRQIRHLSSVEIDSIIQQARASNNPLYWIDEELLRQLRPDVILTQEICEVCAISSGSVYETAAKTLDYQPAFVTVRPAGLEDIFNNIKNIGKVANVPDRASALVRELKHRVKKVQDGLPAASLRPRVFCIDWLNPLRNTGQWVPELVELAGGEEGLALKWGKSREIAWQEVLDYQPDYIMMMPCAFEPERVADESVAWLAEQPGYDTLPAVEKGQVFLFDGRVPSRHGPRVIDVLEGLAEAMHPDLFAGLAPSGLFWRADL
jgi:iron complex transport system substrate-binding protein